MKNQSNHLPPDYPSPEFLLVQSSKLESEHKDQLSGGGDDDDDDVGVSSLRRRRRLSSAAFGSPSSSSTSPSSTFSSLSDSVEVESAG